MRNALYRQTNYKSSGISFNVDGKASEFSDRLRAPMRRRQPIKEILRRRMKELGLKVPDIVRQAAERGNPIPKTTLNGVLNGETLDPRLSTIEAIADGMHIPPEELAADFLGSRTDDPAFKGSQFAILNEIYRSLSPSQRIRADAHIDGLLVQLQHIKAQAK